MNAVFSCALPSIPYPEFPLRPHRNGQWYKSVWNPRTKKSEQCYFGLWKDDPKGDRALHDPVSGWLARRPQGKRSWLRLHEKGGKFHEVPAHHNAVEYLDAYLAAAGIATDAKSALFCSASNKLGGIFGPRMSRTDVLRMVKRRASACGIGIDRVCCHTFRATGITAYLENGGTIENAQAIAAHESPRTTKLYDRTNDALTLDEIERIAI